MADPEKAVVVIQFDYDRNDTENPIPLVVDGLREFFASRDPKPVGNIWAAIGLPAQRVIDVQDPPPYSFASGDTEAGT